MSNHIEPQANCTSPFDAIKLTRPDGSEYWSARDLMPMLGYDRWENFAAAVDRAKIAAEVQGHEVENLFRGVTKKGAGRPQQDYELARFACYLVAMNGDPRKTEIAAAMGYFAVRTREAETRPAIDAASLTRLELLQIAMNAETERMELEAKNLELEPKAEAYDSFLSADGDYSIGAVAKMLGKSQNKMFDLLRSSGIFIAKGAMRNTPYQQYMHHFSVRAHEYERQDGTRGTSYTTKVQPSGIDFLRKKLGLSLV